MPRPVHFEVLANDPETLTAFYRQVLGWEFVTWSGPQGYWLAKTGEADSPGIDGGFMHRHFPQAVINTMQVDDLEATLALAQEAGGKLVHGPADIPGVGRHAYCADPEGILFGLLQPVRA
ncbi:MAG: VOC family protein [Thermoanaerobaculaceae bacterium]